MSASDKEYAFILLKPDSVEEGRAGDILNTISKVLRIVRIRPVYLNEEDVRVIYSDCIHENYFPRLVDFLTDSVSVAIMAEGRDARKKASYIKDCIRENRMIKITEEDLNLLKQGKHPHQEEITRRNALRNLIHVTDSKERTLEHIRLIFEGHAL